MVGVAGTGGKILELVWWFFVFGLAVLGASFVISWTAHKIRKRRPAKYAPKPPWID